MSETICNQTSVGMIVIRDKKILLIERMKFPFGFAPPAGHVDEEETHEDAAKRELAEEVGLKTSSMTLVFEKTLHNICRRVEGTHHLWKVYVVVSEGDVIPSKEETKSHRWVDKHQLHQLMKKAEEYKVGLISESEWTGDPGLELVWVTIFDSIVPSLNEDIF